MRPPPPPRPDPDTPSLAARAGCFLFVALPLVFGLPIATAWARVLGEWIFPLYTLVAIAILLAIIYLLEREE